MITAHGYCFSRGPNMIVAELDQNVAQHSDRAMDEFLAKHPDPSSAAWDAFVVRHTQMQQREFSKALKAAQPLLWEEAKSEAREHRSMKDLVAA